MRIENIQEYFDKRYNLDFMSIASNLPVDSNGTVWDFLSSNPNITFQDVINNPDKPWSWLYLSLNKFSSPYYKSETHKKNLCLVFIETCKEELISKACHPNRTLQWNEDFCNVYYELYQEECDRWKTI
jgi:hypothetical protein